MDLIFDTETTGLPRRGWAPSDPRMPHVVQIAAVLVRYEEAEKDEITLSKEAGNWHEAGTLDAILAWDGIEIPEAAYKVHGITPERMRAEGRPPLTVMKEFDALVRRAMRAISFNLEFDEAVILATYHRVGGTGAAYRKLARACTMQSARPICKLPGKSHSMLEQAAQAKGVRFKTPSLAEAHRALCGGDFKDAHTALGDAMACYAVVRELRRRGAPLGYTPPPAPSVVDVDLRWLDGLIEAADELRSKLTGWENSFLTDMIGRREQYGVATMISEKQRAVLERIWEKVR